MSWQDIIKAPTLNRDSKYPASYRGNRNLSYINDKLMEVIVKDLGLPETDKDGKKIRYTEELDDFRLSPSLKALPNEMYELGMKVEGEVNIYAEGGSTPAHTFTKDDIRFYPNNTKDDSISFDTGNPSSSGGLFSLDYEFSNFYSEKIYLKIIVENQ